MHVSHICALHHLTTDEQDATKQCSGESLEVLVECLNKDFELIERMLEEDDLSVVKLESIGLKNMGVRERGVCDKLAKG